MAHFSGFRYTLGVEKRPEEIHDSMAVLTAIKRKIQSNYGYIVPDHVYFRQGVSAETQQWTSFVVNSLRKVKLEIPPVNPLHILLYCNWAGWLPSDKVTLINNASLQGIGIVVIVDYGTISYEWQEIIPKWYVQMYKFPVYLSGGQSLTCSIWRSK